MLRRIWRSFIRPSGLVLASLLSGCGGSSGSGQESPDSAITVTVESAAKTVQAGATVALVATLRNDTSRLGVTWSISPSSGAGTLSDETATSVTYNAPADPPDADLAVTITATSLDNETKSDSALITVTSIFVAIEPAGAEIEAGGTQTLIAVLQHDLSQAGVTWTISPASGAGSLIDVTSTSATYQAPSAPPTEDLFATVTATPRANEAISAAASIVVPAVVVQLTPDSALLPVDATQRFEATVFHDFGSQGVGWTLTQGANACSPSCGSLEDVNATSATFVAPSEVPAPGAVTLAATSLADPGKSAAAAINISSGSVQLVPTALDFDYVKTGDSRTKGVELTNVGNTTLAISGATIDAGVESIFSVEHDCGASVVAGASCRIDVTFSPTQGHSYDAELSIADSSPDSPQRVPLSGAGLPFPYPSVTALTTRAGTLVAPAPTGRHRLGTGTVGLVDPGREDPYLRDGTNRELLVRFWYPAFVGHGCRPAPYADAAVWTHASELLGRSLPAVRTNSCLDAPPAEGAHPVLVFTHGYTGTFTDYTFLFEDLASRGYIVASVGHTYESTAVRLPDGRLATSVLGSHLATMRTDSQTLSAAESVRLADVRFVIDELARLNSRHDSPFAGHFDLASVGIAGHSFGGLTALQAAERDPRIRAAVVIDGVMPGRSFRGTDAPVLILDAGRERWSSNEKLLWRKLSGQRFALNLNGAEHVAPSDLVWLARSAVDTGRMTPEQAIAGIRDSVAAFLDTALLGMPVDPLLTGRPTRSAGIERTTPAH